MSFFSFALRERNERKDVAPGHRMPRHGMTKKGRKLDRGKGGGRASPFSDEWETHCWNASFDEHINSISDKTKCRASEEKHVGTVRVCED